MDASNFLNDITIYQIPAFAFDLVKVEPVREVEKYHWEVCPEEEAESYSVYIRLTETQEFTCIADSDTERAAECLKRLMEATAKYYEPCKQ